jgi:hypothetical protein
LYLFISLKWVQEINNDILIVIFYDHLKKKQT